MRAPTVRRERRWGVLVAALMTLAVGIAGELIDLPEPLHALSLVVTIASLVVVSKLALGLAAGDP